jgi:diacylglycerol O-acyltransferase / wax synthase
MMDRLSPLDSLFLQIEDGTTHMHIASCAVFERPAPPYEDLVDLVASKLPLLPRYRQKVRFVPAHLASPVWVDDPHFNLAYHIRHSALPAPGGEEELNNLMGRLMAVELDRHRPLWEVWMVEGLTGGRWALISKVHHCMVDGVSGTDLMTLLLDHTRSPGPAPSDDWAPRAEPSAARLAADGMIELLRLPGSQLHAVGELWRDPN